MHNYRYSILLLVAVAFVVQGCASAKKYEVKGYIQDKERVDQEIPSAPIGNWANAPQTPNPERKATRKVFVLEVNKEADFDSILNEPVTDSTPKDVKSTTAERPQPTSAFEAPDVVIPDFDAMSETKPAVQAVSGTETLVEYVVEKDDTLQKISKKFYNTYSKWPKIYEANKSVLKSPDFVKPGTKLVIPVVQ